MHGLCYTLTASINISEPFQKLSTQGIRTISMPLFIAADPHHFKDDPDADPDPACHFDADADSDPSFHFDADADPDPVPSFQIRAQKTKP
jgi:hypothetical protein